MCLGNSGKRSTILAAASFSRSKEKNVIQISRSLARQLKVILRKASRGRAIKPLVELSCQAGELRIRAQLEEAALEYRQPASPGQETLLLPGEALDDFQGRKDSPVTFEKL